MCFIGLEAVVRMCSVKKLFLKVSQYLQKNTCVGVSVEKETPTQVFSYEYYEIFKNTYFWKPAANGSFCWLIHLKVNYIFWQLMAIMKDGQTTLQRVIFAWVMTFA